MVAGHRNIGLMAAVTLGAAVAIDMPRARGASMIDAEPDHPRMRRVREVSGLTPAQQHVYATLTEAHATPHEKALAAAREVDPSVTVHELKEAARRRLAERKAQVAESERQALQAALDKRARKAAKRLAGRSA